MTTELLTDVFGELLDQSEIQRRNRRAFAYIERVRRARRDNCRWWDTLVQRALACGVGAFVLALLMVLWVTR